LERIMEEQGYRFEVTRVTRGGSRSLTKEQRIFSALSVPFMKGRIWLPSRLHRRVGTEWRDMTAFFVNDEYAKFPLGKSDDLLDVLAMAFEDHPKLEPIMFPTSAAARELRRQEANDGDGDGGYSWRSA